MDGWLCVVFLRINGLLNVSDQMNQDYIPPLHTFMFGITEHSYTDKEERERERKNK